MKPHIFLLLLTCYVNLFAQNSNELDKQRVKKIIYEELNNHKLYENTIQLTDKQPYNHNYIIIDSLFIDRDISIEITNDSYKKEVTYKYDSFRKEFITYLDDACFKKFLQLKRDLALYIEVSDEKDYLYYIKLYF